jgi:hypothetical protein
VGSLLDYDPQSLVAPVHSLQAQAGQGAQALGGTPWNYEGALDLTRGAAKTGWVDGYMSQPTPFAAGGKAYETIGRYENPFTEQVLGSSINDLNAHEGQVRAQQALDLAGSGAFGGSGAALTQSMTEGELARARAATLSGLRSQGYNTALQAAAGDADRATQARIANAQTALLDRAQKVGFGFQGQQQQLQAANQLAGIAGNFDANQRSNVGTQADVGAALRGVEQEQRQAPFSTAQQIVAALHGLPIELFKGEQTTANERSVEKSKSLSGGVSGPLG